MIFDGNILVSTEKFESITIEFLAKYIAKQLDAIFPLHGVELDIDKIINTLPTALNRMRPILENVTCFNSDKFYIYNSLQYATFLYLLANEQAKVDSDNLVSDRLFCLNKTLNSIEIFHSVVLPEIFFISHGIGSVLGNAHYGNRFIIFQNVTVGRINEQKPRIGENVILYPGVSITGGTVVGNNCVVSAGIKLHNMNIPDNTIVKEKGGELIFFENKKKLIDLYLSN